MAFPSNIYITEGHLIAPLEPNLWKMNTIIHSTCSNLIIQSKSEFIIAGQTGNKTFGI